MNFRAYFGDEHSKTVLGNLSLLVIVYQLKTENRTFFFSNRKCNHFKACIHFPPYLGKGFGVMTIK